MNRIKPIHGCYCTYDTYMGLTDYNFLRKMVGYKEISMKEDEYAIQIKSRLRSEVMDMPMDLNIKNASGNENLICGGIYFHAFSQDGHNGGDYLLIVPDAVVQTMKPYYSEMAVDLAGKAPKDLQRKLDNLSKQEAVNAMGHADMLLEGGDRNNCSGSDTMFVLTGTNLVRDNLIPEIKFMISSLIVPGFYIGLVFLCVALTVLSVHQLSDSAKYKRRYDLLDKIGGERSQINKVIQKQLIAYYLCPAIFAMLISGGMILRISKSFIAATGVHTSVFQYFGISVLLFFGIYLIYFITTYVGFKRNIYSKE